MARQDEISFGDLISVKGYEGRLFFVDGWSEEKFYTPDETWHEKWFDVTCAFTGEYNMAEAGDVTRVCGADQADEYLKAHSRPPRTFEIFDIMFGKNPYAEWFDQQTKEAEEMFGFNSFNNNNQPRNLSARQLSSIEAERRKKARKERKKKIDALLDEYNDLKLLIEMFDDEEYKAKAEYVALKLAELSAEGDR